MAGNQTKISAFARPKHQAVRSEANRPTVAIERSVANAEPDQSQFQVRPLQTPLRSLGPRYVVDRPPARGPAGMLVHRWPRSQRWRLCWLGLRNRPRGEDRNEDFWRRRFVDQRCIRAFGVVMTPPAFDRDTLFFEQMENLAIAPTKPHTWLYRAADLQNSSPPNFWNQS